MTIRPFNEPVPGNAHGELCGNRHRRTVVSFPIPVTSISRGIWTPRSLSFAISETTYATELLSLGF